MTTTVIEVTRPQPTDASAHEKPPVRREVSAEAWQEVIRALGGTDEDDLPLFGRLPA